MKKPIAQEKLSSLITIFTEHLGVPNPDVTRDCIRSSVHYVKSKFTSRYVEDLIRFPTDLLMIKKITDIDPDSISGDFHHKLIMLEERFAANIDPKFKMFTPFSGDDYHEKRIDRFALLGLTKRRKHSSSDLLLNIRAIVPGNGLEFDCFFPMEYISYIFLHEAYHSSIRNISKGGIHNLFFIRDQQGNAHVVDKYIDRTGCLHVLINEKRKYKSNEIINVYAPIFELETAPGSITMTPSLFRSIVEKQNTLVNAIRNTK